MQPIVTVLAAPTLCVRHDEVVGAVGGEDSLDERVALEELAVIWESPMARVNFRGHLLEIAASEWLNCQVPRIRSQALSFAIRC